MKVLFLMIAYPDVSSNTNMYTDLTGEFLKNGHDVYVAAPHSKKTTFLKEGEAGVLRIKTLPLFNTNVLIKAFANILLPYQYRYAIRRHLGNICFDLVITPTPPITFIDTVRYLKRKCSSKIYLVLRDIFPQNAKDLGIIKNKLIFSFFRRKEKLLYRISDSIGCMSQKNIDFVLSHNPEVNQSKLHLLPNWYNVPSTWKQENSSFKSRIDLKDKFVAVFAGNFGKPQKVEFLIEVAENLSELKEIVFLLVGDGTEKKKIKKLVLDKNIQNVLIIDQLPRMEYLELLQNCNVGLVNLSDKFTIPNIPSRTLSYWALKLPVLAAVDKHTDYGELLDSCKGGLWSITGNLEDYKRNLLLLYSNADMTRQMGENGYNYLKSELNPERAYQTIISNIQL